MIIRKKVVCAFVLLVKLQHINSFTGLLFKKHLDTSIKKHYVPLSKISQAIRVSLPSQYTEAPCSSFLLLSAAFCSSKTSFTRILPASPSDSDQRAASKSGKIYQIPAKVRLHKAQGSCCAVRGCEFPGPSWGYKVVEDTPKNCKYGLLSSKIIRKNLSLNR